MSVISLLMAGALALGADIPDAGNPYPFCAKFHICYFKRHLRKVTFSKNVVVKICRPREYSRMSILHIANHFRVNFEARPNFRGYRLIPVQRNPDIFSPHRTNARWPLPIRRLYHARMLKSAIEGWRVPVIQHFQLYDHGSICGNDNFCIWNHQFDVCAQFSPRRLSSFPKGPDEQTRSYRANQESPESVLRGISSSIRSLPLGAKVGVAIVFSIFAAPILFGGVYDFNSKGRGGRVCGLIRMLLGFGILGVLAGFWWLSSPY